MIQCLDRRRDASRGRALLDDAVHNMDFEALLGCQPC